MNRDRDRCRVIFSFFFLVIALGFFIKYSSFLGLIVGYRDSMLAAKTVHGPVIPEAWADAKLSACVAHRLFSLQIRLPPSACACGDICCCSVETLAATSHCGLHTISCCLLI
jgi:hypothetical protein